MIRRGSMAWAGLLVLGCGLSSPSFAGTIRLDFQGVIAHSDFASVSAGDTVSGYVEYMFPDVPISQGTYPSCDACPTATYASGLQIGALWFELDVNGSAVLPANPLYSGTQLFVLDSSDSLVQDHVEWSWSNVDVTGPIVGEIAPPLRNPINIDLGFFGDSTVFSGTQVPFPFPGLNSWTSEFFEFSAPALPRQGQPLDYIRFQGDITSFATSDIPEPSSFPILLGLLGGAVWTRWRRRPA